ncbi:MAG: sodium:calcium antiporter, partial [Opitutales bacterium]
MSLLLVVLIFCAAGAMIVFVGTRFTGTVDTLADRTGLGEAITGAVFMGATTSIPDIVVSTSTAAAGRPEIAMSNALGGIAVQTAFL